MEYNPYYYQSFAEQFILDNPAAGLLLDMGMGKTAVSLTAADKLLNDYFAVKRVLVIAPLKPAKETWPPEVKKWDHLKHLRVSMILGSKDERIAACTRDADIYIINRENVVWLVDYYKTRWPFDMVIIDELSSFKSSKAQRFRALKKVRKYITRIPILLAHPASAGHGLNLQQGGHIAIWYGLPTSLELFQQANKRLHRPGQKQTVLIHIILMKGTYDYRVLDNILTPKEVRQNALLEALKAKIKEVSK